LAHTQKVIDSPYDGHKMADSRLLRGIEEMSNDFLDGVQCIYCGKTYSADDIDQHISECDGSAKLVETAAGYHEPYDPIKHRKVPKDKIKTATPKKGVKKMAKYEIKEEQDYTKEPYLVNGEQRVDKKSKRKYWTFTCKHCGKVYENVNSASGVVNHIRWAHWEKLGLPEPSLDTTPKLDQKECRLLMKMWADGDDFEDIAKELGYKKNKAEIEEGVKLVQRYGAKLRNKAKEKNKIACPPRTKQANMDYDDLFADCEDLPKKA
jgi:hypothetical protein